MGKYKMVPNVVKQPHWQNMNVHMAKAMLQGTT